MTDTSSISTNDDPNAITVLKAVDGKKLTKQFQANGDIIPYRYAYLFTSRSLVIQTMVVLRIWILHASTKLISINEETDDNFVHGFEF